MAFFKKWKNGSKHRKLSEEWALATSLKDLSHHPDDADDIDDFAAADSSSSSNCAADIATETYAVKYLGHTIIEAARSEEATAEAIKSVISTAKASRKKLPRVNLCISPKGIQMTDQVTGESLMQVSIYKISYCSADAQHSDVFAFVGAEEHVPGSRDRSTTTDEPLVCHAFLCAKRKIAQKVTLTVARSFEQAYQIWRDAAERNQYQVERRNRESKRLLMNAQVAGTPKAVAEADIRNLLIDFSSEITAEICSRDHRELLQNTWVSFEDGAGPLDDGKGHSAKIRHHADVASAWGSNKLVNCA